MRRFNRRRLSRISARRVVIGANAQDLYSPRRLLLESGGFLLQENGDYLLLENSGPGTNSYLVDENGNFIVDENGNYLST